MRDYKLHELPPPMFESLVHHLCLEVLGTGTVAFSSGPDGGRDGRFEGTAESYPSSQEPWQGKFIIQAKHTENPIARCSDGDFWKNRSSTLNREKPRMRRLVEAGEVDNYLLFTNRRLGGEAESKIIRELREETDIPNLAILGLEKIIEFLVAHPKIVRHCGIDLFRAPLRFHAEDIKRVILAFHHQKTTNRLANVLKKFTYREMEEKNEINQLQKEYFDVIKSGSEAYFKQISTFLGDPINAALAEIYGDFATEINHKIELRRNDFAHFAEVFEFLYDEVTAAEPKLRPRELIWVFLHFMYFNCDLGRT